MSNVNDIKKTRIALRSFLLGKGFYNALKAFDYAEKLHGGMRKDGVTPSFHHQISIANYLTTLPLDDESMHLAVTLAILHDTPEDKDVSREELTKLFGEVVANGAMVLAKKFRGVELSYEVYFSNLADDPMVALVKGADRFNNLSTMIGVFKPEKQQSYINETYTWHLPMLKAARRAFPQYTAAFENVKLMILSRMEVNQYYLDILKDIKE